MTSPSTHYPSHFINGQWVQAHSPETLPAYDCSAPFGGYKQPGNGRGNGVYDFEEFLEFKSFQLKPVVV